MISILEIKPKINQIYSRKDLKNKAWENVKIPNQF